MNIGWHKSLLGMMDSSARYLKIGGYEVPGTESVDVNATPGIDFSGDGSVVDVGDIVIPPELQEALDALGLSIDDLGTDFLAGLEDLGADFTGGLDYLGREMSGGFEDVMGGFEDLLGGIEGLGGDLMGGLEGLGGDIVGELIKGLTDNDIIRETNDMVADLVVDQAEMLGGQMADIARSLVGDEFFDPEQFDLPDYARGAFLRMTPTMGRAMNQARARVPTPGPIDMALPSTGVQRATDLTQRGAEGLLSMAQSAMQPAMGLTKGVRSIEKAAEAVPFIGGEGLGDAGHALAFQQGFGGLPFKEK